jgi:hypothetical protein
MLMVDIAAPFVDWLSVLKNTLFIDCDVCQMLLSGYSEGRSKVTPLISGRSCAGQVQRQAFVCMSGTSPTTC